MDLKYYSLKLRFRFEKQVYDEWVAGVEEACSFNLAQPLLNRDEDTKLISVNFDPQVCLTKYLVHYVILVLCHILKTGI